MELIELHNNNSEYEWCRYSWSQEGEFKKKKRKRFPEAYSEFDLQGKLQKKYPTASAGQNVKIIRVRELLASLLVVLLMLNFGMIWFKSLNSFRRHAQDDDWKERKENCRNPTFLYMFIHTHMLSTCFFRDSSFTNTETPCQSDLMCSDQGVHSYFFNISGQYRKKNNTFLH